MEAHDSTVVRTVCGLCHSACGMKVTTRDGRIEMVEGDPEHPANRGDLCVKGRMAKDLVYSPLRLTHPMKKTPEGHAEISWDEALDTIASKLKELKERYGPESLVLHYGAPITDETREAFMQFMTLYGSPNVTSAGHLCRHPTMIASQLTVGDETDVDYENVKCIILWGANPNGSMQLGTRTADGGSAPRVVLKAKRSGVRLIVIDPVRTPTAAYADEWIPIRPGTDGALALAMLHVIIREKLYDKSFVERWVLGFAELAKYVEEYPPERAERITWVPRETIKRIARLFAATKPAGIRLGNGLEMHANAIQTIRATIALAAVTGNIDNPGGNVFLPLEGGRGLPPTTELTRRRLGVEKYPIYRNVAFSIIVDKLLQGSPDRPRAMLVHHANPALVMANPTRVQKALKELEFLVVYDIFKTATSELADIILPDTSFLESMGLRRYSSPNGGMVALRRSVVKPVGESMPPQDVEYQLAKRLGLGDQLPWKDTRGWLGFRLKSSEVTLEHLEKYQWAYITKPLRYKKYEVDGFKTPSREVELHSTILEKLGYEALPMYHEPDESPESTPELYRRYPLIGTTRKPVMYVHTKFRNIPSFQRLQPRPLVWIHLNDASRIGVTDGEGVVVESPRGSIAVKTKVSESVMPGMVSIDFGWGNPRDGGANVNELTSDEYRDPISSSTPNADFLCRVRRA